MLNLLFIARDFSRQNKMIWQAVHASEVNFRTGRWITHDFSCQNTMYSSSIHAFDNFSTISDLVNPWLRQCCPRPTLTQKGLLQRLNPLGRDVGINPHLSSLDFTLQPHLGAVNPKSKIRWIQIQKRTFFKLTGKVMILPKLRGRPNVKIWRY